MSKTDGGPAKKWWHGDGYALDRLWGFCLIAVGISLLRDTGPVGWAGFAGCTSVYVGVLHGIRAEILAAKERTHDRD